MERVMNPRNLIIVRAGAKSLHHGWMKPKDERNFDLLVAYYEDLPSCVSESGITYVHVAGKKVEGWHLLMSSCAEQIKQYDYVAFIDDDIETSATQLSRLFAIGYKLQLSIWQPSLSWTSYFTYAGTLSNPSFRIRYVNYIEMMAPFFSRNALARVKPLFGYGWESGLDLIWGNALQPTARRFAIVDEVQVRHTRPVGLKKEENGFVNKGYESHIYACLAHFRLEWPSLISFTALTPSDKVISGANLAASVLRLLPAIAQSPTRHVLRLVFDHLRHQIFRRPKYNENVSSIIAGDAKNASQRKLSSQHGL